MDISKAFNVGGDYRDRKAPVNWESRLFAEVVFLDKTNPDAKPQLYQLKDSEISHTPPLIIKANAISFSRDAFVLLGEVAIIDKKKKQILLTNKNTISYQYLVIVSGSKPILSYQDPEFGPGLKALVDALRMKPEIPTALATAKKEHLKKAPHKNNPASQEDSATPIGQVVHPQIASAGTKSISLDLNALNKRLYEVQL